jgi:ribonuclease HI
MFTTNQQRIYDVLKQHGDIEIIDLFLQEIGMIKQLHTTQIEKQSTPIYTLYSSSTFIPKRDECYVLQFDGGCQQNPGPACGAAILFQPNGKCLGECGMYIEKSTNNVAEYNGLCIGLELAKKKGVKHVFIEGDSQLVVQQVSKQWKIKDSKLESLYQTILQLIQSGVFLSVQIRHIYRQENTHADRLTREGIQLKTSFERLYDF